MFMLIKISDLIKIVFNKLNQMPAPDINLFARIWIATIFYQSGRTKAGDGFLEVSNSALTLFEYEYTVPILSPEIAAQLALYMETFIPILLIFGIASRFSAFGLLIMTAIIQFFVYPSSWPDHIMWSIALIFIILRGAGIISIDHLIHAKYGRH